MIETFTPCTFREGDIFRVYFGNEGHYKEIILNKIKTFDSKIPGLDRIPFSLIFKGTKDIWLSQDTYKVSQERIGAFELFIVPITGPVNADMFYYQATFC